MENSLKQVLFIEFFGLPGCGKSTLSHLLLERLRAVGLKVSEPSYVIDHRRPLLRKIHKLFLGGYYYSLKHGMYKSVYKIVNKNGYRGAECFTQTVNILQKLATYGKSQTAQIVIWDQGLVQAAISLSLLGKVEAADNLQILFGFLPSTKNIYNVFINVDEELAFERMSKRSTNDSRIEKTKNEEQKSLLFRRFQKGVCSINSIFPMVEVDGALALENEVEELYGKIVNRISM